MTAPTFNALDDLVREVAELQAPATPLIGDEWFGLQPGEGRRSVLMAVTLSPEMMTAALFVCGGSLGLSAADLADDKEAWGFIAQVLAEDGMLFLEEAARNLPALEREGRLPPVGSGSDSDSASWLAFCRERVATLATGGRS